MKFPEKLWSIVNECTSGAIGWGKEDNIIFIDYDRFEKEFLGKQIGVFNTENIVSFVRQLNLYGFRKVFRLNNVHEFKNPYFVRGRKDLLQLLQRKLGHGIKNSKKQKIEKTKSVSSEKEQNVAQTSGKTETYNNFPVDLLDFSGIKLDSSDGLNSSPYNWWNNAYSYMNPAFPMPWNNTMFSQRLYSPFMEGVGNANNSLSSEFGSTNPSNFDMQNNIIFVPVPAQYVFHPGFYSENFGGTPYNTKSSENRASGE